MRWNILVPLLCSLLVVCAGCKRPQQINSVKASSAVQQRISAKSKIEACALITKEEVGAVQSTTISDIKSSEGRGGNYLITQCYYSATGPNLSVSLTVTQRDPKNPSAPSPREQWEQTFDRFDKENETKAKEEVEKKGEKEHDREEAEGEKMQPPKKIDGVGEEAFWSGNRFGGALYVLKGDVFIRVSVGGPDNEETKIEKSKTLAEKALHRL